MTYATAQGHARKLRGLGFTCEVWQFSPDRSGWGIACDGQSLRTVADVAMVMRVEARLWKDFTNAVARDAD
jgi:hypothetical protein